MVMTGREGFVAALTAHSDRQSSKIVQNGEPFSNSCTDLAEPYLDKNQQACQQMTNKLKGKATGSALSRMGIGRPLCAVIHVGCFSVEIEIGCAALIRAVRVSTGR
jgi:hypothetical protein